MTRVVQVSTPTRSYPIAIGAAILDAPSQWGAAARRGVLVVTDASVGPLYAARLVEALRPLARWVDVIELPGDGEALKSWPSIERIVDALLDRRADRTSLLVALGGGVVGDVAGFAAASFMRGIDFVQVPTTLLAQVDSSVGGKTGINHERGKNLIGAFHQPIRVIADTDTLSTLSQRQLLAGLAEVVKYGAVADDAFLSWLESNVDALLARDGDALADAIRRSCELKAAIVAEDERETGRRVILNFGHTFAHAIESGTGYAWLHGEAVGCGMVLAAEASSRLGMIDRAHGERLAELIRRVGLPTRAPSLGAEAFVDWMRSDKKAEHGELRLVLLAGPGRAVARSVDSAFVAALIRDHERGA